MKKISLLFVIFVAMVAGAFSAPAVAMADPVTLTEANEFLVKEFGLNPLVFSEEGWKADVRRGAYVKFVLTNLIKENGGNIIDIDSIEVVRFYYKPKDTSISDLTEKIFTALEKVYEEKWQGQTAGFPMEKVEVISVAGKTLSGTHQRTKINYWAEKKNARIDFNVDMYLIDIGRNLILEVGKSSGSRVTEEIISAKERCEEILTKLFVKISPPLISAPPTSIVVTPASVVTVVSPK